MKSQTAIIILFILLISIFVFFGYLFYVRKLTVNPLNRKLPTPNKSTVMEEKILTPEEKRKKILDNLNSIKPIAGPKDVGISDITSSTSTADTDNNVVSSSGETESEEKMAITEEQVPKSEEEIKEDILSNLKELKAY